MRGDIRFQIELCKIGAPMRCDAIQSTVKIMHAKWTVSKRPQKQCIWINTAYEQRMKMNHDAFIWCIGMGDHLMCLSGACDQQIMRL